MCVYGVCVTLSLSFCVSVPLVIFFLSYKASVKTSQTASGLVVWDGQFVVFTCQQFCSDPVVQSQNRMCLTLPLQLIQHY
jgi:hypothetical protein